MTARGEPDWLPRWSPPELYEDTEGDEVIDFAANLLKVTKGFVAGRALTLTPWQQWLVRCVYERRPDGRRRYRRGLVGVGRKNGKSLIGSTIALHGLYLGPPGAEVYACAGDRQQARIVFGEAKQQVLESPALARISRVYRDAIEVTSQGAIFRVLSADAKLQQGLNPSLVLFDEVHVQPNNDLWDAMTLGSGARVDPLVLGITTAGYDLDTLCGELYLYGQRVAAGEIVDETFGMWWWEAAEECDVFSDDAWRAANPNLDEGLLDPEDLETAAKQTNESAFRRYRLNQWTRALDSWLPAGAWNDCAGDASFDSALPVCVGVDMALKHDSIAVVAVQLRDNAWRVLSHVWFPAGSTIDVAAVENYLRDLHRSWRLSEVAYDPAYFERSAQALADDGLPMVEFPQSAARMVPACQVAYELICSRQVVHDGDPVLADQIASGAVRQTEAGWRLSKGKSKRKIDAAIALTMALARGTARGPVPTQYSETRGMTVV